MTSAGNDGVQGKFSKMGLCTEPLTSSRDWMTVFGLNDQHFIKKENLTNLHALFSCGRWLHRMDDFEMQ